MVVENSPLDILQKYWGHRDFRPLQSDIIQSVLDGKDTLALLPTGGGKSICFQVPALCKEGICVVISPLIALMKDQVENLQKRGIPAVAIYSGMNFRDIDRILDNAVYGSYKFLYLSPERLMTELAVERIKRMNVNILAIDEAHCISQWGYDFRPPYLKIAELKAHLPKVPIIALTATATPEVVVDIQDKLEFDKKNKAVFQQSFQRSNLVYAVRYSEDKENKLLEILKNVLGSAVVYVRNRKMTKEYAHFLVKNGVSADFYHAGMSAEERSTKQDDWIQNKVRVVVATNAFGMGIDKPDVRLVVHLDLPDNLEAYFQEAGRGGRDGLKSYSVLLYNRTDKRQLENNFIVSYPEMKDIRRVYHALGNYFQLATGSGLGNSFDFEIQYFCSHFGFDILPTYSALKVLEQEGWLILSESVFIASTIEFKVNREQLYECQVARKDFERITKGILRFLQGCFTAPVNFNEGQLAKNMKMPVSELIVILKLLTSEGILEYIPYKEKPQLIFLRERVDHKLLSINQSLYQFRKKRHEFKIKKAIEYAEIEICRSKQLLHYFGETETVDCGQCDVCLDKKNSQLGTEDYEGYRKKVLLLLKREALSLTELVDSFAVKHRIRVIRTIEYLIDNGEIVKDNEKYRVA
jgi:ATP-dependent DNA helicase RecQ